MDWPGPLWRREHHCLRDIKEDLVEQQGEWSKCEPECECEYESVALALAFGFVSE